MLRPLKNKVIVKIQENKKTESGLVLTGNLETDTIVATVLAMPKDGSNEIKGVNIGDKVIISKFSGSKIQYDKKEYVVLDIDNILAIVEEE